jgi:hypothetical protein
MRITIDTLSEFDACKRGKDKFCELFPDGWEGEWTLDKQLEIIRSPLRIFAGWAFKAGLVPMLSMQEVNLSMADLSGVDLHGANLRRANLSGANLRRANLSGANLHRANLSGANMSKANLYRANLSDANLSDANLYFANIAEANLNGANLTHIMRYSPFGTVNNYAIG